MAALLLASAARADEASRRTKAEEMLRLTNAEQMMKQYFDQMQAMQTAQLAKMPGAANIQDRIMQLVKDRMSWEKLRPAFVQLYVDTYTDEELDGIIAFYKSPAGRAFVEKMPVLMNKSMKLTQNMVGDLTPEIVRIAAEAAKEKK
jgi:uncharacterized protein